MKTLFKALGLSLALLVAVPAAGCAQLAGLTKNEQVSLYDEKALLALEVSYGFVLQTVISAGQAGYIDRPTAELLIPLLNKTEAAMAKARALYAQGQAAEASLATSEVFVAFTTLVDALKAAGFIR